jgi:hypothetical protein
MTITRLRFDISASDPGGDTGAAHDSTTDTGPSVWGELVQVRWVPSTGDTGGDLQLIHLPVAPESDTGENQIFFNDNDCLGAGFTRAPRQPQHGSDGAADPADTGAAFGVPVYFGGDRLRVKVTNGATELLVGKLYAWFKD